MYVCICCSLAEGVHSSKYLSYRDVDYNTQCVDNQTISVALCRSKVLCFFLLALANELNILCKFMIFLLHRCWRRRQHKIGKNSLSFGYNGIKINTIIRTTVHSWCEDHISSIP